ncbi:thymidylate kinase-domain-containing protein [Radiomyces spectabilis]|uniref:thymidylate kinase-domain-containing protein n=1 Tax=Radiomyces spectabilis TaxID=64574 RepID=UPI00221F95D9|nr:thymidylate kinase-domain-containing protein [Radiomyces spectabilis]KAI8366670.1 thymidylate kinase-domain-containing protein [Radiomyces spectabilis]
MTTRRGLFIVVEGCDRAGKSTQCERLVQRMRGEQLGTELLKFPDRTTQTGQMIDGYLKQTQHLDDHAIHLLFSANRWEAIDTMTSLLNSGTNLVVDRYAFSGVAFSAAKGLSLDWCKQPDVGLLTPDVVLFLDLPIEEAERRGGFGDERYEKRELQIIVRQKFGQLMESSWKVIDASESMDKVHEAMWDAIQSKMQASTLEDLRFDLWKA